MEKTVIIPESLYQELISVLSDHMFIYYGEGDDADEDNNYPVINVKWALEEIWNKQNPFG